jgi:hypothetical protein
MVECRVAREHPILLASNFLPSVIPKFLLCGIVALANIAVTEFRFLKFCNHIISQNNKLENELFSRIF